MDNIFEIEQIKNDLYRCIMRMEKCDFYYPYANLGYEYFVQQYITANFDIYHVTTTGRKNSAAWNNMVDMTEYEIY